jgi:type VI secretion system protein
VGLEKDAAMPLVLHLATSDPAGGGAARRIEVARRLTIGRGPGNDLVLADPNRHLSKNHCVIDYDGSGYVITDASANGVFLDNGAERLPRGAPVPLAEGNVLRLGSHELTVAAIVPSQSPPLASQPLVDPAGDAGRGTAEVDGFLSDPLAGPDEVDAARVRMADSMSNSDASPDRDFDSAPSALPMPVGQHIPDDIDLFGEDRAEENWHVVSRPDHASSDQAFFAAPRATTEAIPEGWEMSVMAGPRRAGAPPPAISAVRPGADSGPHRQVKPASAVSATSGAVAGGEAGLAGFLGALGLAGTTLSEAEKVKFMRLAGGALAAAVRGLSEILATRADTKQEFRIERTIIGPAANNPLKFAASVEEAMRIMLLDRTPGFLRAEDAVEEALRDIKSHQLAVLAGMQVALRTVISRFDPDRLERRLEQGSLIEGILPAARKARRWELFRALYKEIAAELEDDFQKAFGAEFARAYEEQVNGLRGAIRTPAKAKFQPDIRKQL